MSKLHGVVVLFLALAACQPGVDQEQVEDVCTQVVKDGLATCTQDAWNLCDQAYSTIMEDLQAQNDALKEQIRTLSNQVEAGCNTYVNGAVADTMHTYGCALAMDGDVSRWYCPSQSLACRAPAP